MNKKNVKIKFDVVKPIKSWFDFNHSLFRLLSMLFCVAISCLLIYKFNIYSIVSLLFSLLVFQLLEYLHEQRHRFYQYYNILSQVTFERDKIIIDQMPDFFTSQDIVFIELIISYYAGYKRNKHDEIYNGIYFLKIHTINNTSVGLNFLIKTEKEYVIFKQLLNDYISDNLKIEFKDSHTEHKVAYEKLYL